MLKRILGASVVASWLGISGAALATDCGTSCDTSGRQGRTFSSSDSVVAAGAGAPKLVRTWIPLLKDANTSFLSDSLVQVVDGKILGAVSMFNPPFTSGQLDAALCFWPANIRIPSTGFYASNDLFLFEPGDFSDVIGELMPDGRSVWRANFNSGAAQNNIEWRSLAVGQDTPLPEPAAGAKVLAGPGIDGAAGSVFLGTPSALSDGAGGFFVGISTFDAFTGNCPLGIGIWNEDGVPGTTLPASVATYTYLQSAAETWATSNGVPVSVGGGRQTQPVLRQIQGVRYLVFGVNDTAQGGSARPGIFAVDAFEDGDGFAGAVAVLPPVGFAFVDHQATGGGSGPFENSHFDINDNGQIAALVETITDPNDTPSYAAVLYNPTFSGGRISGYDAPVVIADAGPIDTVDDGLAGPIFDPNEPDPFINSISGVSINNRGNIAFSATYDTEIPFDPNDPNSLTIWSSAAYLYDSATGTLHQVLRRNDVISYDDGRGAFEVAIGTLGQEQGDSFFGRNLADGADVLVANFRVNGNPKLPGGSSGVAVVAVGHVGDVDFSGVVDLTDLALLLGAFGTTFETPGYDPQADYDLDGDIDLVDLSVLLSTFGSVQ